MYAIPRWLFCLLLVAGITDATSTVKVDGETMRIYSVVAMRSLSYDE